MSGPPDPPHTPAGPRGAEAEKTVVHGADTAQLTHLASRYESCAREMVERSGRLSTLVASVRWEGRDADAFRESWSSLERRIRARHDELQRQGRELQQHAEEQDRASANEAAASSCRGRRRRSARCPAAGGRPRRRRSTRSTTHWRSRRTTPLPPRRETRPTASARTRARPPSPRRTPRGTRSRPPSATTVFAIERIEREWPDGHEGCVAHAAARLDQSGTFAETVGGDCQLNDPGTGGEHPGRRESPGR